MLFGKYCLEIVVADSVNADFLLFVVFWIVEILRAVFFREGVFFYSIDIVIIGVGKVFMFLGRRFRGEGFTGGLINDYF